MSALFLILLGSTVLHLLVLEHMPAWRPFAMVNTFDNARALACASGAAIAVVTTVAWLVSDQILARWNFDYLRVVATAALVLIAVPVIELAARKFMHAVPLQPGFRLLLTAHPSILGVALLAQATVATFWSALGFALGAAFASVVLLLTFAALHERLRHAEVPAPMRHAPLLLISAGMAALGLMGLTGLVRE